MISRANSLPRSFNENFCADRSVHCLISRVWLGQCLCVDLRRRYGILGCCVHLHNNGQVRWYTFCLLSLEGALFACHVIIVLDHTSSIPTTYESEEDSCLNRDEKESYIQVNTVQYHLGSSPSTTGPINARVVAYNHKSSTGHWKLPSIFGMASSAQNRVAS